MNMAGGHADQFRQAAEAYTSAYLHLEGALPGFQATEIDGMRQIRFGRPKAGVTTELIAGNVAVPVVLDVMRRHPTLADGYVSIFRSGHAEPDPAIADAGFTRIIHNYLMCCDVTAAREAKPDDTVVQLTTVDEIERLAELREDGQILPTFLADPALRCYALVIDDVPAASAMLVALGGRLAVIEYVHTLERYRRRGYGRWLMRALHREAAHAGADAVVLSSNEGGHPLYVALGYELLGYEDVYVR